MSRATMSDATVCAMPHWATKPAESVVSAASALK